MTYKVVHITPVYPPYAGGIGVVAKSMAEGLAEKGWEIEVVTPETSNSTQPASPKPQRGEPPLKMRGGEGGVMTARVTYLKPWLRIGNAAVVPQLRKLDGYDMVHLHYPFFGGAEWLFFNNSISSKRTKLIVQYHHDADASGVRGLIFKWYGKIILPRLLTLADKVIVSSMDYARHSHITKFINEKFVEIPLGVDEKRFYPQAECHSGAEQSEAIESRHSVAQDPIARLAFALASLAVATARRAKRASLQDDKPFTILFVGSLDRAHWFKGLEVLLRALAHLKKMMPISNDRGILGSEKEWRCLIIGDGDLRPRYERQAHDLGVADKVQFLGKVFHEQLPEQYRHADLFVFPSVSRAEAFGLVVLEAMASGLPVIVSDLPGVRTLVGRHPDSVRAGEGSPANAGQSCGFTFPVGDHNRLAQLMLAFMQDKPLRKKMSLAAREKVLTNYTWKNIVDRVNDVYSYIE